MKPTTPRRFLKKTGRLTPEFAQRLARAQMLDRLADAELQHGHHYAAEHLSRRAADLRDVVQ